MKRNLIIAVGALALLTVAGAAFALQNEQVKVRVPFQFTVNEKVMPAGIYEIFYADPNDTTSMDLRNTNGKAEDTFLVEDVDALNGAAKTEVVFDQVGTQYFLREIWVAGQPEGHQAPLTKVEKELIGNGAAKTVTRLTAEHTMHKAM